MKQEPSTRMMVVVGREPIMADPTTLEFPMGAVTSSLKSLTRGEIADMELIEMRAKLKQAIPFGFVDLQPHEIDSMDIDAAGNALLEASDRARSRSV